VEDNNSGEYSGGINLISQSFSVEIVEIAESEEVISEEATQEAALDEMYKGVVMV